MTEVKIVERQLKRWGKRGINVFLPPAWIEDNQLEPGDTVEIFRTGGARDDLIIRKAEPKEE